MAYLFLLLMSLYSSTWADSFNIEIVGGRPVLNFPNYFVGLYDNSFEQLICGGALIHHRVVLTAAHCIENPKDLYVTTMTKAKDTPETRIRVLKAIVHEDFDSTTLKNDLALLLLEDDSVRSLSRPLVPISLDSDDSTQDVSRIFTVFGFGNLSSYGQLFSDSLYQVELKAIPVSTCKKIKVYNDIGSSQICAGDLSRGGVDSCQGDSGGPLTMMTPHGVVLAGVVSWGQGCAQPGLPGIYTRVAAFRQWIEQKVNSFFQPAPALTSERILDDLDSECETLQKVEAISLGQNSLKKMYLYARPSHLKSTNIFETAGAVVWTCDWQTTWGENMHAEAREIAGIKTRRTVLQVQKSGQKSGFVSELTDADREIVMTCLDSDSTTVFVMNKDSGAIRLNEDIYFAKLAPSLQSFVHDPGQSSCQIQDHQYTLYPVTAKLDGPWVTKISFPFLSEKDLYFKLLPTSESSSSSSSLETLKTSQVTVRYTHKDRNLKIINTTQTSIFNWLMICNQVFQLSDSQGRRILAKTSSDAKKSGFLFLKNVANEDYAALAPQQSMNFKVEGTLAPQLECTINSHSTQTIFN